MTTVMPWYWLFAFLTITAAKEQTRWSRQISSYTSDLGDWVPLPGPMMEPETVQSPVKRQSVAQPRILAEPFPGFRPPFAQDQFPSRNIYQTPLNRQLYLSSVPSAPQNYLSDQGFGQNVRFGLTQPNFPLAQGFVSPQMGFENGAPQFSPQIHIQHKQRVPVTNPISYPKPHGHEHFVSSQAKPFNMPQTQQRPATNPPKFVDGYKLENNTFTFQSNKKKPQQIQKVKFESKIPEAMVNKPKSEREEVQLLYVPMDTLNRGQYTFKAPDPNMGDPNVYSALQQKTAQQSYVPDFQRPPSSPVEKFSFGQDFYQNYNTNNYNPFNANPNPNPLNLKDYDQVPKFSTLSTPPFATAAPTTQAPKKLKPHQPPLAIFLAQEARKGDNIKVGDVLLSLKNAHTIQVLDAVNPNNAPKVFIGPSNLAAPEKYVKFELPYLSNIENSDKKLRQMPFFVAPLSYNTPDGFAKIPFPSPHVGSVIVNSQIRDSGANRPLSAEVTPNAYTAVPQQHKEQKSPAQKPTFSYYSTAAPKTNPPPPKQNFYSFEQQQVNALKNKEKETPLMSAPPTKNLYFITKDSQYNQNLKFIGKAEDYPESDVADIQKPGGDIYEEQYRSTAKPPPTQPPTKYTTTQQASTYPSQLLETHNPYSINQAFHLSTPLDLNHYIEDGFATPPSKQFSQSEVTKPKEIPTEKPKFVVQQQNYLHNYNPEIQFESDQHNSRYPQHYEHNQAPPTRQQPVQHYESIQAPPAREQQPQNYESYQGPPSRQPQNNFVNRDAIQVNSGYSGPTEPQASIGSSTEGQVEASYAPQESNENNGPENYNQYNNNADEYNKEPVQDTTTTTSTTTTRRSVVRPRGRPRYTTQKPNTANSDNNEGTTRATVRRPLRERKPVSSRPKYEPNRITTEKPERAERPERPSRRQPVDDSTTRATRSRTRGKVQFKASDETFKGLDENNDGKQKTKDQDLAYQRDVLHQNYPVTLMERMSTVDIEAITEPLPRISSTRNLESVTIAHDTENAYSNEYSLASVGDKLETFTNRPEIETTAYVPRVSNPEYSFHQRSSPASEVNPTNSISLSNKDENIYYSRSSSAATRAPEVSTTTTTESVPVTNSDIRYSSREDHSQVYAKEEVTTPEVYNEVSRNTETEPPAEEAPQTTPAYNRVRVRPGGLRPYAQRSTSAPVSTTKAPRTDERKRQQAVTYRPAYDKRRTTMRIDEIEADLKTKQIRQRPDSDYRHPVYKPEPTTEGPNTTPLQEGTTKRGQFRKRRPSYTSSTTEGAVTKKATYDVNKNRFRGRRPTDRTTSSAETTEASAATTTVKAVSQSRYTRPRLSERFNRRPADIPDEPEDQDSNFSFNRPKYAFLDDKPGVEQWSTDSFKPYNPNDIKDDQKQATTEHRTSISDDLETDIITARNDYDDILVSVTPASNQLNKKVPDIPPTLEALVEQSKNTNTEAGEMSTFETMLEEVMKTLEEQDRDEYGNNVKKHKGGEIGEIPPERVISDGDKTTTVLEREVTTSTPEAFTSSPASEEPTEKPRDRRRGFWKKVHVRPVTPESIDVAESQYYSNTVNHLGTPLKQDPYSRKQANQARQKSKVTTYKPALSLQDFLDAEEEALDAITNREIPKLSVKTTTEAVKEETERETPYELDLGTGAPDTTLSDMFYSPTTTEATSEVGPMGLVDRSDGFNFMDYLFGIDSESEGTDKATPKSSEVTIDTQTEAPKATQQTTENTFLPDEITTSTQEDATDMSTFNFDDLKKINSTEDSKVDDKSKNEIENIVESTEKNVELSESSTLSSFMDPSQVMSTSMSTEVSHETEICFRGKCIKTKRNILL